MLSVVLLAYHLRAGLCLGEKHRDSQVEILSSTKINIQQARKDLGV